MTIAGARLHKHFVLNAAKIKRAKRLLHAETETDAIERALDFVVSEYEKNRLVLEANKGLGDSGTEIRDVYGVLSD